MAANFPPTSRYAGTDTSTVTTPDGQISAFLRRRFVPQPETLAQYASHMVVQGDRLDNVAAQYLGDPEQFWRIADANRSMDPDSLTARPGRTLRICLPEGMPGAPNA